MAKQRSNSKSRTPLITERFIQRSIIEYARLLLPECIVAHVPNGGSRNVIEAANLKRDGALAGFPDLIILGPNKTTLLCEVKSPIGKVSPLQRDLGMRLTSMGHAWAVVRSIEDFELACKTVGLIK